MAIDNFDSPSGLIVMHAESTMHIKKIEISWKVCESVSSLKHEKSSKLMIEGQPCQDLANETIQVQINQEQWMQVMDTLRTKNLTYSVEIWIEYENVIRRPNSFGLIYASLSDNPQDYILYTKLAPSRARSLFPCFDEPRFEARFKLIAEVHNHAFVISNTLNKHVFDVHQSKKIIFFAKTDYINADQLIYVQGRFSIIKKTHRRSSISFKLIKFNDFDLHKWPVDILNGWAMDMYKKAFVDIENLLDFDRKSIARSVFTVAALPSAIGDELNGLSFVAKPIEWFVEGHKPNSSQKTSIMKEIVSQVARQWIGGNLRRASNYDIWLYDGLISWIVLRVVPHLYWSYDSELDFLSYLYFNVMDNDANELGSENIMDVDQQLHKYFSTPPQTNLTEFDDLSEGVVFDQIKKIKSYAIIRLIEDVCTKDKMLIVMRQLVQYSQKIFRTSDFLDLVRNICKWDAKDVVTSHLEARGFALITVDLDDSGQKIVLTREECRDDYTKPEANQVLVDRYLPVTLSIFNPESGKNFNSMLYFSGDTLRREIQLPPNVSDNFYVKVNLNYALYRVEYSDRLMERFFAPISFRGMIMDRDQVNIINDAYYLVKSGRKPSIYLIRLLRVLKYTSNEFILDIMIKSYLHLKFTYMHTAEEKLIDELANEIFINIFLRTNIVTGVEGWRVNRRNTVGFIYSLLINLGNHDVRRWSHQVSFEVPMGQLCKFDYIHQAAHLAYLVRCEAVACQLFFHDLIKAFEQQQFDHLIFVQATALSDKQDRLAEAWAVILKVSPQNAVLFIETAMLNEQGREFIRKDIINKVDVLQYIKPKTMRKVMQKLCLIDQLHYPCNDRDFLVRTIGQEFWDNLEDARAKRSKQQSMNLDELRTELDLTTSQMPIN